MQCDLTTQLMTSRISFGLHHAKLVVGVFVARLLYKLALNAVLLNVSAISIRSSRKIRNDSRRFMLHRVPRLLATSVSALRESMKHYPFAELRTQNIGTWFVMPSRCLSAVNVICHIYVLDDHLRPLLVFTCFTAVRESTTALVAMSDQDDTSSQRDLMSIIQLDQKHQVRQTRASTRRTRRLSRTRNSDSRLDKYARNST